MRLLNTKDFKVQEFPSPDNIPRYAIISHTWDPDSGKELTFQKIRNLEKAKLHHGWRKIKGACSRALKFGFDWIWIDTCCINKESSAELSEALNSMYRYYSDSEVCYAYLSDVPSGQDPRDGKSVFKKSRWFQRAWTLQELITPSYVVFFDENWMEIGTRWSLRDAVSVITSIPIEVFQGKKLEEFSVAQRMSWAAFRESSKPEDKAYSLMGIFGVRMSPIYGEGGENAFIRLQQEIIKISDDRSIFAWIARPGCNEPRGLLARYPYEFRAAGNIQRSQSDIPGSYSFGNNGLHIELPLHRIRGPNHDGQFLASLDSMNNNRCHIFIYLSARETYGQFVRCRADEIALVRNPPDTKIRMVDVKEEQIPLKTKTRTTPKSDHTKYQVKLRLSLSTQKYFTFDACSGGSMDKKKSILKLENSNNTFLLYKDKNRTKAFSIKFQHHPTNLPNIQLKTYHKSDNGKWCSSQANPSFPPLHADRIFEPFNEGCGLISLAIQMTGNVNIGALDIEYIADNKLPLPPLQRPQFGFTVRVDSRIPLKSMDTFPSDLYEREWVEKETIVSIPEAPPRFRVLTFMEMDSMKQKVKDPGVTIYVALGIENDIPWTDIISGGKGQPPKSAEEIQKLYLNSGARVQKRLGCQTEASVSIPLYSQVDQKNPQKIQCSVAFETPKRLKLTCFYPQKSQNKDAKGQART
ncbi:hypothetical protein VKT23_008046 [Stygiomarasmius scandens]|uniref:Heterokaryon incompatibility domain-containing protein n=1 Tax=Marasmiellus scandens TaxID=2682957 RepID=A0ABR1JJR4_9AGAR